MKTLKLKLIGLLLLTCFVSIQSKAQNIEVTLGIDVSEFSQGGVKYRNIEFNSTSFVSQSIGINYCFYTKEDNPLVVSLNLSNQKGKISFREVEYLDYYQEVTFNTRYLAVGFQPFTYVSPNRKLELTAAAELVFLINDRSSYFEQGISVAPSSSSFYYFRDIEVSNKNRGLQGKLIASYVYDLGNKTYFVPKLIVRIADLKNHEIINGEIGIGLELAYRF